MHRSQFWITDVRVAQADPVWWIKGKVTWASTRNWKRRVRALKTILFWTATSSATNAPTETSNSPAKSKNTRPVLKLKNASKSYAKLNISEPSMKRNCSRKWSNNCWTVSIRPREGLWLVVPRPEVIKWTNSENRNNRAIWRKSGINNMSTKMSLSTKPMRKTNVMTISNKSSGKKNLIFMSFHEYTELRLIWMTIK